MKKLILLSVVIFITCCIINAPAWLIGPLLQHFSKDKIHTSYESGTVWNGKSLLLIHTDKYDVPIMYVGWKVNLFARSIIFYNGTKPICNILFHTDKIEITDVNLSLPLQPFSVGINVLNNIKAAGNIQIMSKNISIGKQNTGVLNVLINHFSAGVVPINPLGNYNLSLNLKTQYINLTSSPDSILELSSNGKMPLNIEINVHDPAIEDFVKMVAKKENDHYRLQL